MAWLEAEPATSEVPDGQIAIRSNNSIFERKTTPMLGVPHEMACLTTSA